MAAPKNKPELAEEAPKVLISIDTNGVIKSHRTMLLAPSRYQGQPYPVPTDLTVDIPEDAKVAIVVSLDDKIAAKKHLSLIGPTLISEAGPVVLYISNIGISPTTLNEGDVIGKFVKLTGKVAQ